MLKFLAMTLRGKDKQKVEEELEKQRKKAELFDKSDGKPTAMQKTETIDIWTACASNQPKLLEIMFNKGIGVNGRNANQRTLVMIAADAGHAETLEFLLNWPKPILLDAVDESGNTALHLAAIHQREDCALLLVRKGINVKIANKEGKRWSDMTLNQLFLAKVNECIISYLKREPEPKEMSAKDREKSVAHQRRERVRAKSISQDESPLATSPSVTLANTPSSTSPRSLHAGTHSRASRKKSTDHPKAEVEIAISVNTNDNSSANVEKPFLKQGTISRAAPRRASVGEDTFVPVQPQIQASSKTTETSLRPGPSKGTPPNPGRERAKSVGTFSDSDKRDTVKLRKPKTEYRTVNATELHKELDSLTSSVISNVQDRPRFLTCQVDVAAKSLSQLILGIQKIPGATPVYENEVHEIGELGKDLLVQLKTMLDSVIEQAGGESAVVGANAMRFADRDVVLAQVQKVKQDHFYQLYEGLKAMRTTLGDIGKLDGAIKLLREALYSLYVEIEKFDHSVLLLRLKDLVVVTKELMESVNKSEMAPTLVHDCASILADFAQLSLVYSFSFGQMAIQPALFTLIHHTLQSGRAFLTLCYHCLHSRQLSPNVEDDLKDHFKKLIQLVKAFSELLREPKVASEDMQCSQILSQALRLFHETNEANATRVLTTNEKVVMKKLPELLEGVKHLTKAAIQNPIVPLTLVESSKEISVLLSAYVPLLRECRRDSVDRSAFEHCLGGLEHLATQLLILGNMCGQSKTIHANMDGFLLRHTADTMALTFLILFGEREGK